MPSTNPVHQQIHTDGYAIITLDRPERRNALNLEIKQLLAEAVEALAGDPRVHALVITGAGGYFVAGTDIAEMRDMTPLNTRPCKPDACSKSSTAAKSR